MSNATKTRKPTATQIAILAKLEAASRDGGLSLFDLFNNRETHAQMAELQRMGLWFQLSATQGNITDAGCAVLTA